MQIIKKGGFEKSTRCRDVFQSIGGLGKKGPAGFVLIARKGRTFEKYTLGI